MRGGYRTQEMKMSGVLLAIFASRQNKRQISLDNTATYFGGLALLNSNCELPLFVLVFVLLKGYHTSLECSL